VPKQFEEQFAVKYFTEVFDRVAALYLLQHKDEYGLSTVKSGSQHISEEETIEHLLHEGKGENNIKTWYNKPMRGWNAQGKTSMQGMSKKLRSTLCKDLYIEIGFVNCIPTNLLNLCQKHKIPCDLLEESVVNHENMLNRFKPLYNCEKAHQVIKELIDGTQERFFDRTLEESTLCWLSALGNELNLIRLNLTDCDDYEETRIMYNNSSDRKAKFMSAVLSTEENVCLEHLYNFVASNGVIQNGNCVLCLDGIMVHKTPENEALIDEAFLNAALDHIKQTKAHTFSLGVKSNPFSSGYELLVDYISIVAQKYLLSMQTATRIKLSRTSLSV